MPRKKAATTLIEPVDPLIQIIRGERVILDSDLARLYGVTTKRLNEQVRRNAEKFPSDFVFQLEPQEFANLKSQFATSSYDHGGRRKLPLAFTEHGTIMAANVLNSPEAVQMSVFVVRAFVKMRAALTDTRELAKKLTELEAELKTRLDVHEVAIVDILQRLMTILAPSSEPPATEHTTREIGFHTKAVTTPIIKAKRKRSP